MWTFFNSKVKKSVIDVNLNQQNAIWLLNEELTRLHKLFNDERKRSNNKHNLNTYWSNIHTLQQQVITLAAKSQDPDVQKAIADLQNHIVDQILIEE